MSASARNIFTWLLLPIRLFHSQYNHICDYDTKFTENAPASWAFNPSQCTISQLDSSSYANGALTWLGSKPSWTDYIVESTFRLTSGGDPWIGLAFRVQSVGDTWNSGKLYCAFLLPDDYQKTVALYRLSNGGWTELKTVNTGSITYNVDYKLKVDISGSSMSIYVNNTLILSHSDSSLTYGSVGFRSYSGTVTFKTLFLTGLGIPTMEPTTNVPTTHAPTITIINTINPTTNQPTTVSPTTYAPTTYAPTTEQPTTNFPTTHQPSYQPSTSPTQIPTTSNPTTATPTTHSPTTYIPTTNSPTRATPTTSNPTTDNPTTNRPTTYQPTTSVPTTYSPTRSTVTTSNPTSFNATKYNTVARGGSGEINMETTVSDNNLNENDEKNSTSNAYATNIMFYIIAGSIACCICILLIGLFIKIKKHKEVKQKNLTVMTKDDPKHCDYNNRMRSRSPTSQNNSTFTNTNVFNSDTTQISHDAQYFQRHLSSVMVGSDMIMNDILNDMNGDNHVTAGGPTGTNDIDLDENNVGEGDSGTGDTMVDDAEQEIIEMVNTGTPQGGEHIQHNIDNKQENYPISPLSMGPMSHQSDYNVMNENNNFMISPTKGNPNIKEDEFIVEDEQDVARGYIADSADGIIYGHTTNGYDDGIVHI